MILEKIPMGIGQGALTRLLTSRRLSASRRLLTSPRRLTFRRPIVLLPLVLALSLSFAACSDVSPAFGQYYKGRVLHLNLVTLERTPELLYVHGNKHFRIRPSEEGLELVLLRVKVENHTATSAIINIDSKAAEMRDFFRGKYFPINPNERQEEVDAPANPADERTLVFLWNPTFQDGTSQAFELDKGNGIDGWMVFEAPKDTKFREFRWRAGDTLSIDF